MIYRDFTKNCLNVSQLGFGCMRFPTEKIDDKHIIVEDKAIEMLRYAYENGVNYFDTAYFYHNGESEVVLGKALSGIRQNVFIADKFPTGFAKSEDSMEEILDGQLKKLQTNYVDFYMLHGIGKATIETIKKFKLLEKAEELKAKGKIKYFGFSFHDNFDAFKELIDLYNKWDFVQIQYNYLDENNQAGTKGLEYAHSKGLSVIIMEPLRGGTLTNMPDDIYKILNNYSPNISPANWALSWLWDKKEVSIVLSGMSSLEQTKENTKIAENAHIGDFDIAKKEILKEVCNAYEKRIKVSCTDCKYCMPCPSGVDIPWNFATLNNDFKYNTVNRWSYNAENNKSKNASNCVGCHKCEEKCPQKIEIAKHLQDMSKVY
jgi:hypothetical protein